MLPSIADTLLNLVFPTDCVACGNAVGEWASGALCRECERRLVPESGPCCARCGGPVGTDAVCVACLAGVTTVDFGRAALVFDPALRQVIHQFKYNDRVSLARPLGRALAACLQREPFEAEVVAPVPLHPKRERKRGYNQAALLAARIGRPVRTDLVVRRRPTESQTGLGRVSRASNVRGAFALVGSAPETVLIVDDVETTGATLNEVARVLKRGGATRVEALTVTRVGDDSM